MQIYKKKSKDVPKNDKQLINMLYYFYYFIFIIYLFEI